MEADLLDLPVEMEDISHPSKHGTVYGTPTCQEQARSMKKTCPGCSRGVLKTEASCFHCQHHAHTVCDQIMTRKSGDRQFLFTPCEEGIRFTKETGDP